LADPSSVTRGYRPALAVAAGLSVTGAIVALWLRRTPAVESEEGGRKKRVTGTATPDDGVRPDPVRV
jgi:hypothetical protein